MLIVKVKEGETVDSALKRLKNKVVKTKQMDELRRRKEFELKSVKRRKAVLNAVYVQKKNRELE